MGDFDRLRWRCRRGLLELDLVLDRFLESRYPSLSTEQRQVFSGLLDLADNDLWDLISGRRRSPDPDREAVLELLRSA